MGGRHNTRSRRSRLGGFFQRPLSRILSRDDRSTAATTSTSEVILSSSPSSPDKTAHCNNLALTTTTTKPIDRSRPIASHEEQMIFHKSLKQIAKRYLQETDKRKHSERLHCQALNCSYGDTTNRTVSSSEESDSDVNSCVEEIVDQRSDLQQQPTNFWVRALSSVSVCTMPELCSGDFTESTPEDTSRQASSHSLPMENTRARHNSILMDELFCVAADEELAMDYDDESSIQSAPMIPTMVSRQTSSLPDKTLGEIYVRDDDSTISTRLTLYLNGDYPARK